MKDEKDAVKDESRVRCFFLAFAPLGETSLIMMFKQD